MILKLIGAALVLTSCGGIGLLMSSCYKREETLLREMIGILDFMQCDLQYRLTPLPELCVNAAGEHHGILGRVLQTLAAELESNGSPSAANCMVRAVGSATDLPHFVKMALLKLGDVMGRFDLDGQVMGFESVREYCRKKLEEMEQNRDQRLRSYQTLGLCAGAALAILLV